MSPLAWSGTWNVRRLPSTPASDTGMLIRSASLDALDDTGRAAMRAASVARVVDLRCTHERTNTPALSSVIERVHAPLEDGLAHDPEFVGWQRTGWLGTPLYYTPYLARFRDRAERALAAILAPAEGAVVFHCAAGWDRTGMLALMILVRRGVDEESALADYLESAAQVRSPAARALGIESRAAAVERVVGTAGTTVEATVRAFFRAERARASGRAQ